MNTYITLPCGCKLTPTTVVAMCLWHSQQWQSENAERERQYRHFVERMTRDPYRPANTADVP